MTGKKILVLGGSGFIGGHMVRHKKMTGNWVRAVDIEPAKHGCLEADEFYQGDLMNPDVCKRAFGGIIFDEVYQFSAWMGGAGVIFTGNNDYRIMHNSGLLNINVADACVRYGAKKVFFSSSACVYPKHNQTDPNNPKCPENSAWPADPDSDYGVEKIFSERLYKAASRNHNLDVRIARFHNIFGPEGTWKGGKEKAPAAMCRKALEADPTLEVWGPGNQTRSFLYIKDCIEAVSLLMSSDKTLAIANPINIGSEEMISINNLAKMAISFLDNPEKVSIKNISGPVGVMGRNSDNRRIEELLDWKPKYSLEEGMKETFQWIKEQMNKNACV